MLRDQRLQTIRRLITLAYKNIPGRPQGRLMRCTLPAQPGADRRTAIALRLLERTAEELNMLEDELAMAGAVDEASSPVS